MWCEQESAKMMMERTGKSLDATNCHFSAEDLTNKSRLGKYFLIVIVVGIIVLVIVGLAGLAFSFFFGEVDHRIFLATRNCSGDGFSSLYYNKTGASGHSNLIFFKYKYVEDMENDRMYNFDQAVAKCLEMNSTLWEILDGNHEWDSVITMAREKDLTSIWLNGKATGSCPDNKKVCLEEEAERGEGLRVSWHTSMFARYSRLYKSPQPGRNCLHVDEKTDELLWTTDFCKVHSHWALCTKRNCIPE